jgi:hypothetical protein
MWLFLPDAFYSVRVYDPEKGGVAVDQPHVVVRARVESDVEKVRSATNGSFDLPQGSDYKYHLAVPVSEWTHFLGQVVEQMDSREQMKGYDNPRIEVHTQVWNATWDLNSLDRA